MRRLQKFIVVPFRVVRGRPNPLFNEFRTATSEEQACRMARVMADHYDAVAAYEVHVEEETGEMHEPRELIALGRAPSLDQLEDMAA